MKTRYGQKTDKTNTKHFWDYQLKPVQLALYPKLTLYIEMSTIISKENFVTNNKEIIWPK